LTSDEKGPSLYKEKKTKKNFPYGLLTWRRRISKKKKTRDFEAFLKGMITREASEARKKGKRGWGGRRVRKPEKKKISSGFK